MFNKNKKNKEEAPKIPVSYANWEQDFGFLTLVLARQVNMNNIFYIDAYSSQLDKFDTLKDSDLKDAHIEIVYNVYKTFSKTYTDFLINKYFANEEELIQFISDNVYIELLNKADAKNKEKIRQFMYKKTVKNINAINLKGQKESDNK